MLVRQMWPVKQFGLLGLRSVSRANMWPRLSALAGNSLRVLMYHRVCDPDARGFFGMESVVSARPDQFAAQMDYISRYYNPISIDQCVSWIYENKPLPSRAVLVTFDDGYRDNMTNALPILSARNIPFAVFVATGYLDDEQAFFWDWASEAFCQSHVKAAYLPELGERNWRNGYSQTVAAEWIKAVAPLGGNARASAITGLSEILDFPVTRPPAGTYLTWADLEEMSRQGCTIGAHTVTHPMMIGLSVEQARYELATSKAELEKRLGTPILSFAFPFGNTDKYDTVYLPLLAELGFKIAFRSTGAFNLRNECRRNPYEVRRCGIGLNDTLEDVAFCVSGVPRLWQH